MAVIGCVLEMLPIRLQKPSLASHEPYDRKKDRGCNAPKVYHRIRLYSLLIFLLQVHKLLDLIKLVENFRFVRMLYVVAPVRV